MHPAESLRPPPAAATALLDRLGRLGGLVVAFGPMPAIAATSASRRCSLRCAGLAQRRGFAHVATGTHLDDRRASHRPGLRAAAELGVREPLAEGGATKQVVRVLAAHWNLSVRDKPSTHAWPPGSRWGCR